MQAVHSLGYSSLDSCASDVKVSVDKDLRLQLQLHGDFEPSPTGRFLPLLPALLCMQLTSVAVTLCMLTQGLNGGLRVRRLKPGKVRHVWGLCQP